MIQVFEFDLTPNRSDALSMLGVAYEVAAILSEEVKLPEINYTESTEKAEDVLKIAYRSKRRKSNVCRESCEKRTKLQSHQLWFKTA